MPVKRDTHRAQSLLATHCRTGKAVLIPGVTPDRIGVYRELIGNVFESNLNHVYPIARQALGDERWNQLVDAFFAEHDAHTPYYWKMPAELLVFVRKKRYANKWKKAWLEDLLLFEWLEVELFMMADRPIPLYQREGDLMQQPLVLNPEFRLDALHYPVFRVPPSQLDEQAGLYFLLSYRHPESLETNFIELAPLFAFVIEVLASHPMSGEEVLKLAHKQFSGLDLKKLLRQGEPFFNELRDRWALLGVLPKE